MLLKSKGDICGPQRRNHNVFDLPWTVQAKFTQKLSGCHKIYQAPTSICNFFLFPYFLHLLKYYTVRWFGLLCCVVMCMCFTGQPSIEKCKKVRKKREEAQEIAELDVSNIIATQGNFFFFGVYVSYYKLYQFSGGKQSLLHIFK